MTDSIDDIRKQVEERKEQEAAQLTATHPGQKGKPEIDTVFVQGCVDRNELGDGELYATHFRDKFLYSKNTQEWYEWVGHSWKRDQMNRSLAAVEEITDHYIAEYKSIGTKIIDLVAHGNGDDSNAGKIKKLKKDQEFIFNRVSQLRGDKRRNACLKFAHTCAAPIAITGEEFDMHPMLLPCTNGVIDLETGKLNPGRPGDYLAKASPIIFTGIDTPAPIWERSLDEIFNGNHNIIAYLRRLFGYAITGLVNEKLFSVFYGKTGWNGRSLIIETISHVMGDLAGAIPSEMLLSQKFIKSASGPSSDLMSLKGIRMAVASETDENQRFSASKVKWLTGKDELVGRTPYVKYATRFHPTHKLFLMTNSQPSAPPNDRAFWERLHLVPFSISFVNRDPQDLHERRAILDLDQQLKKESSGILAWLVRGCLEWQRCGLKPPKEVLEATEQYRRNEDLLADFIDECCVVEPMVKEKASVLYGRFVEWYHENHGKKEPSGTFFGKGLSQKFEKSKYNGFVTYVGLKLLND
jgi:putative DNA primase/helicase